MKKIMDKLINKVKVNKKIIVFLSVVGIIALIAGSIFMVMLDKSDKSLVKEYLTSFINDVGQNKITYWPVFKNSLISNGSLAIGIWLLGISVIGIPIILFLFFAHIFTFGFTIASILVNYKFKGILLSLAYVFPQFLLKIGILFILVSYALILSIKLITTIIKKKQIDFKIISSKYTWILLISLIVMVLCSLYESFVLPNIVKLIVPILK